MRVHLNGGPWYDRVVAVEDDHDHFHIIAPGDGFWDFRQAEVPPTPTDPVPTKEGMYSQVGRLSTPLKGEFEWDGWVTHD